MKVSPPDCCDPCTVPLLNDHKRLRFFAECLVSLSKQKMAPCESGSWRENQIRSCLEDQIPAARFEGDGAGPGPP